MAYVSKALNIIKDSFVWQADFVQAHPWTTIAMVWALTFVALVF